MKVGSLPKKDPASDDFNDWAKEVADRAASVPGISGSGGPPSLLPTDGSAGSIVSGATKGTLSDK